MLWRRLCATKARGEGGSPPRSRAAQEMEGGPPQPPCRRRLGSVRKSVSMINRQSAGPVASLRYFDKALREVQDCDWTKGYWRHLEDHLEKCEVYRERRRQPALGTARPGFAQPTASRPAASATGKDKGRPTR